MSEEWGEGPGCEQWSSLAMISKRKIDRGAWASPREACNCWAAPLKLDLGMDPASTSDLIGLLLKSTYIIGEVTARPSLWLSQYVDI